MRITNFKNKTNRRDFHSGQLVSDHVRLLSEESKKLRDESKFESLIVDSLLPPFASNGGPSRCQKSKIYTSWLCTSGPLTVSAGIPRKCFSDTEVLPITIEVINESNVAVRFIKIELKQTIKWKVENRTVYETIVMKRRILGGVGKKTSTTRIKEINLTQSEYTTLYSNRENCKVSEVTHSLYIEVHPKGLHFNFKLKIPISISATPPTEFKSNPNFVGYTYPPYNEVFTGEKCGPIYMLCYPQDHPINIRRPEAFMPGNI